MRELDELLGAWLENRYEATDEREKAAFGALLELSDPELVSYLLGDAVPPDQELANIVERIRNRA